jgi:phage terminase small subunit
MPGGRPPAPIEHHRRVGRANGTKKADGRALPAIAEIVQLPQAEGMPDFPADLDQAGKDLWRRIWQDGITWISPKTDAQAAEEACRAADDVAAARRRYRATTDPKDATALVSLGKRLDEALSMLGFNPTARSRLGVAEVRRVSALDELIERRAGRG